MPAVRPSKKPTRKTEHSRDSSLVCSPDDGTLLNRSGCNLTMFPAIDISSLFLLKYINLRNNRIADLKLVRPQAHSMWNVKCIDISYNRLQTVEAVLVLAQTTPNLVAIYLAGNELCHEINFLFDLLVSFPQLRTISFSQYEAMSEQSQHERELQLTINVNLKGNLVAAQFSVGNKLLQMLLGIVTIIQCMCDQTYTEGSQHLFAELYTQIVQQLKEYESQPQVSLPIDKFYLRNEIIQKLLDGFLFAIQPILSQHTSCFQQDSLDEQQIREQSQYMIDPKHDFSQYVPLAELQAESHKNGTQQQKQQCKHNNIMDTQVMKDKMIGFYCGKMILQQHMLQKILYSVNIETEQQEEDLITSSKNSEQAIKLLTLHLMHRQSRSYILAMKHKKAFWQDKLAVCLSPYKSVQTEATTERQKSQRLCRTEEPYFSMDRDWVQLTRDFVVKQINSIASKLKVYMQETGKINHQQLVNQYMSNIQINTKMAETMMTTFNKKTDLKRIGIIPKSPNKILSNSLCRILDRILKLFIFNKIKRYRAIQRSDVLTFMKPIQNHFRRCIGKAFDSIFVYAINMEQKLQAMQSYRLQVCFSAWRTIKKRRDKLLKRILSKRAKEEVGFAAISFVQWRINARNISLKIKVKAVTNELKVSEAHHIPPRKLIRGMMSMREIPRLQFLPLRQPLIDTKYGQTVKSIGLARASRQRRNELKEQLQ